MSLRGRQHVVNVPVSNEMASFLVVRLGASQLALPAAGVRGILTREEAGGEQAVTALGDVYRSIDLAERLSLLVDSSNLDMRTVLYSYGRSQGAIRVEQVVGLIDVERKDCFPLPAHFRRDERTWFVGMMLSQQDQLALILDPSWVVGESPGSVLASVAQVERIMPRSPTAVEGLC